MKTGKLVLMNSLISIFTICQASAGVFDDVKIWWHLDYDANNDGIVQVNELRDQTDWGTHATPGASGHHAVSITTPDVIKWTNNVPITSGGLPYGNMAIVMAPATNFSEGAKLCWPEVIRINDAAVSGSSTMLCRFRWDGDAYDSTEPGWLINNGLRWADQAIDGRGWIFGFRPDGGNHYLHILIGNQGYDYPNFPLKKGIWYEAGVILTDNGEADTIEFFLWPEDYWPDEEARTANSGLTFQTLNTSAITNVLAEGMRDVLIGGETQYDSLSTEPQARKGFRGALNYFAIWDRALSHNEMLEAFGYHSPLLSIGMKNNNNNELITESEAAAIYDIGDPWHTFSRAVTTGFPETTIRAVLTELQAQQNYALHIDIVNTDNSQPAKLELIVNSTTNETFSGLPHQQLFWEIPASQLMVGTNLFVIRYTGGPAAWVSWDWLEISGSWQVGFDNNTQSEFTQESHYSTDYLISDPVWKHVRRAITGYSGADIMRLNFTLSQAMIDRYDFTYIVDIRDQGFASPAPQPPYPVTLKINGNIITNGMAVADNTIVSFQLPDSLLTNGNNAIQWKMETVPSTTWLQFDYHRLEMTLPPGPPKGTLILVR